MKEPRRATVPPRRMRAPQAGGRLSATHALMLPVAVQDEQLVRQFHDPATIVPSHRREKSGFQAGRVRAAFYFPLGNTCLPLCRQRVEQRRWAPTHAVPSVAQQPGDPRIAGALGVGLRWPACVRLLTDRGTAASAGAAAGGLGPPACAAPCARPDAHAGRRAAQRACVRQGGCAGGDFESTGWGGGQALSARWIDFGHCVRDCVGRLQPSGLQY